MMRRLILRGFIVAFAFGGCDVPADPAPEPIRFWEQPAVKQGQLSGQVVDVVSGAPLGEAAVELPGGQRTSTASNGSFDIEAPVGRTRVLIRREGYLTGGREVAVAALKTEAIFRLMRIAPAQPIGAEGGTLVSGSVTLQVPPGTYPPGSSVSVTYVPHDQVDTIPGPPQYTDEDGVPRRIVDVVALGSSVAPAMPVVMSAPVPREASDGDVRLVSLDGDGAWIIPIPPVSVADGQAVFEVPGDGIWGVSVDAGVPDTRNIGYLVEQPGDAPGLQPGQVVMGGTQLTAGSHTTVIVDPHGSTVEIGAGSTVILDAPEGESGGGDGGAPDAGHADGGLTGARPVSMPPGRTLPHAGHITLVRGWVKLLVPRARPREIGNYRMHLRTLLALYSVKGTAFSVSTCLSGGHVVEAMEVQEGNVETRAGSDQRAVSAGSARTLCAGCAAGSSPVCPAGTSTATADGGTPMATADGGTPMAMADGGTSDGRALDGRAPDGGVPDAADGAKLDGGKLDATAPDLPPPNPDAPPPPPAALTGAPGMLAFDPLSVGSSSPPQTFAVTNSGGSPTGMPSVMVTGDFSEATNGCTGPLDPGERCEVTVRFEPSQAGPRGGSVVVSASPGGTAMAALAGTGLAPAMLGLAPRRANFGSLRVGTPSAAQTFTLSNGGGVPSTILQIGLEGTNTRDFEVTGNDCPAMLDAGASCTVTLRFVPTAGGARSASLAVSGNPGGKVTAALDGVGVVPVARLQIAPANHDFGSVTLGAVSAGVGYTVSNAGDAPTGPVTVRVAGANAKDFAVVADGCNGMAVDPGKSCQVMVQFGPIAAGARTATLQATGTPGGTPTANLTGTGVSIVAKPDTLVFTGLVGMRSQPQTVMVTNPGSTPTGPLSLASTNLEVFPITGDGCSKVPLAAGASCAISVSFLPAVVGQASAALTISGAGTASVKLSGTATTPLPALALTPPTGQYGGKCNEDISFTLTNNGSSATAPLRITVSQSTPAPPSVFSINPNAVNTCQGVSLQPAATCIITVRFLLLNGSGDFVGSLDITDGNVKAAASLAGGATNCVSLGTPRRAVHMAAVTLPQMAAPPPAPPAHGNRQDLPASLNRG